jgi:hypothetical protein
VDKVKQAVKDFVGYVQENEPAQRCILPGSNSAIRLGFWTSLFFTDAAAQTRHGRSEAVKCFETVYSPELVGGDVVFTNYELIAGKPTSEQWVL